MYADCLVLMAGTMAQQKKEFYSWKSALESKSLKVNLVKRRVMVSEIGLVIVQPSCKNVQCGICGRKTMENAVFCKSCGH